MRQEYKKKEEKNRKRRRDEEKEEEERRKHILFERNEEIEREKREIEGMIGQLKDDWRHLEQEKQQLNDGLESMEVFYPSTVNHSEQQTDIGGTTIDELICEKQLLQQSLQSLVFDTHLIQGDDGKTT